MTIKILDAYKLQKGEKIYVNIRVKVDGVDYVEEDGEYCQAYVGDEYGKIAIDVFGKETVAMFKEGRHLTLKNAMFRESGEFKKDKELAVSDDNTIEETPPSEQTITSVKTQNNLTKKNSPPNMVFYVLVPTPNKKIVKTSKKAKKGDIV